MQLSARNQHYQVRSPCDGKALIVDGVPITIKVTGEESDGAFTIFESTVPAHFSGQPAQLQPQLPVFVLMLILTLPRSIV